MSPHYEACQMNKSKLEERQTAQTTPQLSKQRNEDKPMKPIPKDSHIRKPKKGL